jgi:hypothetical protein
VLFSRTVFKAFAGEKTPRLHKKPATVFCTGKQCVEAGKNKYFFRHFQAKPKINCDVSLAGYQTFAAVLPEILLQRTLKKYPENLGGLSPLTS